MMQDENAPYAPDPQETPRESAVGGSQHALLPHQHHSPSAMSTITVDNAGPLKTPVDRPLQHEVLRAKWDSFKTATHTRRVILGCVVEAIGVYIYSLPPILTVYAIMSSPSGYDEVKTPFVNVMTSLACILSVCLATIVCMPSSRGYLHPCFTIMTCFSGLCSWAEAPFYIVSQALGAFLSTLTVVGIYWDSFRPIWRAYKMGLLPPDKIWSSTGLLAGIINVKPSSRSWGPVFLNQTVECTMVSMAVCAALDSTNVFVAPTMVPLIAGTIFGLALLANLDAWITDNPAVWIGGRLTCSIVFGRADLCWPIRDTIMVIFGPLLGFAIGFLCYWLLLADIRRPSASAVMQQAELEAEALAETAQRIHDDAKALKAEKRALAKMQQQQQQTQQRTFQEQRNHQLQQERQQREEQHQQEQQLRQRLAPAALEHVEVAREIEVMRMGKGPQGVGSAFRSSSPERLRSIRGHGDEDKEDDEVEAEGDVFRYDQGRPSVSIYSNRTTPSSNLERSMTTPRASQSESIMMPLPTLGRQQ